jgi:hypothetical protein
VDVHKKGPQHRNFVEGHEIRAFVTAYIYPCRLTECTPTVQNAAEKLKARTKYALSQTGEIENPVCSHLDGGSRSIRSCKSGLASPVVLSELSLC